MSLRIRPTTSGTTTVAPAERSPADRHQPDRPPLLPTVAPAVPPMSAGRPVSARSPVSADPLVLPTGDGRTGSPTPGGSSDQLAEPDDEDSRGGTRSELRAARRLRRRLMVACALVIAVCVVLTVLIVGTARDRLPVSTGPLPSPAGPAPTTPTLAMSALTLLSIPPIPGAPAS